ncbi:unspecified product [Leishmania tarentolae]|uniref:Unspecified product n=1 Tax=Leishmania tarentolae TaxID=5689 RepID=A0A640KT94_LEITA|nr:unspecified product [Leishmania tarentolae]
MFRSWGELTSCASEVFDLFAEPLPEASGVNRAAPSQDVAVPADVGLRRVGLECAFYVLFGRYPTPSLIADCFAMSLPSPSPARGDSSAPPLQSPPVVQGGRVTHSKSNSPFDPPNDAQLSRTGGKCFVTRPAFQRFVTLCAEEEGDGFVTEQRQGDAASDAAAAAFSVDCKSAVQLQWWRQFQSVAGPKGFMTADDLCGIHLEGPFADVQEVLAAQSPVCASNCSTASQQKLSRTRQVPLVQHIFWILDRDHDGSVCFEDVQPYLRGR